MRQRQPWSIARFVDRDLAESYRPISTFAPIFVMAIAFMTTQDAPMTRILLAALLLPLAVIWYGFVFGRGWRLFKAFSERGDRQYDRMGKFALPPEYADTESATAARTRRKRFRRKR